MSDKLRNECRNGRG